MGLDYYYKNEAAAREIENMRDELCQRCGNYHVSHMGGCNGCRYE